MSDAPATDSTPKRFHVVGIGASAGGLESLEKLFSSVPARSGMAFVVIQHLSPHFKSMMDELLARHTEIPIHRAEENMLVAPNNIYLIPPKMEMIIAQGRLLLTDKDPEGGLTLPIDHFFRSLAQDAGELAIGVILSGSGSDGSRGIKEIAASNGLVIAESEDSARFEGMPRSAIQTGVVHRSLRPEDIPEALLEHIGSAPAQNQKAPPEALEGVEAIFDLLRRDHGIDFSHYKPTTVTRRIERRLSLNHNVSLETYVEHLRSTPEELGALYKDLLIGVTCFFRDPESFSRLESEIAQLVEEDTDDQEMRVWVAGCATGEEAYSLAILFYEALEAAGKPFNLKMFATDVHKASLEIASQGIYQEEQLEQISSQRLSRYFTRMKDGYLVSQDLRQRIVFAQHNVLMDAPFTHMDLVTCRNLLIYFQPQAQKKALSLFHFGLRTGGLLFLGSSETPGELTDEFQTLDEHCKVFRKRRDVRLPTEMRLPMSVAAKHGATTMPSSRGYPSSSLISVYDQLLNQHMPPSFLVSESRELLDSFGGAERFLHVRARRPSQDLLDLLQSEMKTAIAGGLQRATKEQDHVCFSGLRINEGSELRTYQLTVAPVRVPQSSVLYYLITLEPVESFDPIPVKSESIDQSSLSSQQISALEEELAYAKESLQAAIEELETSNEELQATNEELVASNEELQSTNEELHSVNEELYTVNAEHQRKIAELNELNHDVNHLLESTDVGTVFLDHELRIRKFTPKVAETFDLLTQDIGRRIHSFAHRLEHSDLLPALELVLRTGIRIEREVCDTHGNHWFLRILPYRVKGMVQGLVLTLVDISVLVQARAEAQHLSAIVEDSNDAILSVNLQGQITSWNEGTTKLYGFNEEEALGEHIHLIVPEDLQNSHRELWLNAVAGKVVQNVETVRARKDGARIDVALTISPVRDSRGEVVGCSSICRDITRRKLTERQLTLEHALIKILSEITDFQQASSRILRQFCKVLSFQYGEVWLPSESGERLTLAGTFCASDLILSDDWIATTRTTTFEIGEGLPGVVWKTRQPQYCENLAEETIFTRQTLWRNAELWNAYGIPIRENKACIGVLTLFTRDRFSNNQALLNAFEAVGDVIGQSIRRQRSEAALARSARKFRDTFENAAVGMAHVALDGRWLQVNQRLCQITGYDEDELRQRTFQQIAHPDDLDTDLASREQLLTGKISQFQMEKRYIRKDGQSIWVNLTVSLSRDAKDMPAFFIVIVEDITEKKLAAEELRQAVRRREEFLAMLSHELRNPLNAIRTAARVLSTQGVEPSVEARSREIIGRQTTQMTRLLDDLMDVARITQNKIELRRERLDLCKLVEESVEATQDFAQERDIEIDVDCPGEPLSVQGDSTRLQQVVCNLLTNAVKYSPPGERVLIRLGREDNQAVISVKDNGVGISTNMLEQVFELFVQSENELARSTGGMGVGLTLVRTLVELHGGSVVARSEGPGHGSELVVRINLDLTPTAPTSQASLSNPCQREIKSLVVIEDETDNRELLQTLLMMDGFLVEGAGDGVTGIELILQTLPDAAIVDIGLPGKTGYEVAREVREQLGQGIYLIALTGYGQTQDVRRAMDAGFDVHLVKPLDPASLLRLLSSEESSTANQ